MGRGRTRSTSPSPAPTPSRTTERTGPDRPDPGPWTVRIRPSRLDGHVWIDGRDAAPGGIDIRRVRTTSYRRAEWRLELGAAPQEGWTLHPPRRVIGYGVVLDTDGDLAAHCRIGLDGDSPTGDLRVWVVNLRTGETDERVGPPYGLPIDFAYPSRLEPVDGRVWRPAMSFFFLFGTKPCDPISGSASFSTWASHTRGGVTRWDFAPDNAWLEMP